MFSECKITVYSTRITLSFHFLPSGLIPHWAEGKRAHLYEHQMCGSVVFVHIIADRILSLCLVLLHSCIWMISIWSTKGTAHSKLEKTVHKGSPYIYSFWEWQRCALVRSVKYARACSLAGLEFVTRLVWGEQREARLKAWQTPFFFAFGQPTFTAISILERPPTSPHSRATF